ncbi:MAG TPA: VOC family protein [Solirubrobacterales bacterium]|nr:VOC family protein [Solirubrobacterales bacterium]
MGVVVDDFEAATTFFLDLGLHREGAGSVEGEWVEKVVGLDDVQVEFVMVKTPDGSGKLELIKFHRPADEEGAHPEPANRLGIRHVALVVDDLDAIVTGLRDKGMDTIGAVENYEDTFLLCYVRGPEGIIVELAERIASRGPSTEP